MIDISIAMATIECNNTQDPYPTENGDTIPEEKNLSIDYNEDLWLANEDSSGPYQQTKGTEVANVPRAQSETQSVQRNAENEDNQVNLLLSS